MNKEIIINSPEEMILLGRKIGRLLQKNQIITLEGDLGAGKTTFTKGIALGLGINEVVNSPTFTIMKIYDGRLPLYHLDVYRLENSYDDFELEEYFEKDGVCVIEWANRIKELLNVEKLQISIFNIGDNKRKVQIIADTKVYEDIIKEVLQ